MVHCDQHSSPAEQQCQRSECAMQRVLSPFSGPVFPVPMHSPPLPGGHLVPSVTMWTSSATPAFGPQSVHFLPAPVAPVAVAPMPPPYQSPPMFEMPGSHVAPPAPVTMRGPPQPMLPSQTAATLAEAASEIIADCLCRPAQPMPPPQTSAARPVILAVPASRPPPRCMAPAIITPPHPEGLKRLLEQRERDGAASVAPVDKPRRAAFVTSMPSEAELARLRAIVDERKEAGAREHVRRLLGDPAQRRAVDGCPGGHAWSLAERCVAKAAPETSVLLPCPVVPHDMDASPAAAPAPASVRIFCSHRNTCRECLPEAALGANNQGCRSIREQYFTAVISMLVKLS